jgi:hypothetical protein
MQKSIGRIDWPAQSWLRKHGQVFLAWAIFNPNGPTLFSLGFVDNGEDRHVFLRSQNPFREAAYSLGAVRPDDPEQADSISNLIHATLDISPNAALHGVEPFACIPSLVSLPAGDSVRAFARDWLLSALSARAFDWGREWYYLQKYGDDLFARAGEETREALELWRTSQPDSDATRQVVEMAVNRFGKLASFNEWRSAAWTHRTFDTPGFDRWLTKLNQERFYSRGFFRWAQAWVGASRFFAADSGPTIAVRLDDVLAYLRHYGHPIWPLDWTEETIAALSGASGPWGGSPNK